MNAFTVMSDTDLSPPSDCERHVFADYSGVADVCATTRESQVSYQSISQQMERATSSRTTGARCQLLHSRHGMQASIRTSLRRSRAAVSPPDLVVGEACSDRMAVRARGFNRGALAAALMHSQGVLRA